MDMSGLIYPTRGIRAVVTTRWYVLFLASAAGLVLGAGVGMSQSRGLTHEPRVIAQAGSVPYPQVVPYVLTEDIPALPASFTGYTIISRTQIDQVFNYQADASDTALYLFVSKSKLLSSTQIGDPFLFDRLWSTILSRGHGLFVFDATSTEIAQTLELRIPHSNDNAGEMSGIRKVGVSVRRYQRRAFADGSSGISGGCGSEPGFAVAAIGSILEIVDTDNNDSIEFSEAPQYEYAWSMVRMAALETQSLQAVEDEGGGADPNLDSQMLIAGSYSQPFHWWGAFRRGGNLVPVTCAFASAGILSRLILADTPDCAWWELCDPNTCPGLSWGVERILYSRGNGSRWRPLPGGGIVEDTTCPNDNTVIAFGLLGTSNIGDAQSESLSRWAPLTDVTSDGHVSQVTVGGGFPSGVYGEATWQFGNGTVDFYSDCAPEGATRWDNNYYMGFPIGHTHHEDNPQAYDPAHINNARGREAHRAFATSPGEEWLTSLMYGDTLLFHTRFDFLLYVAMFITPDNRLVDGSFIDGNPTDNPTGGTTVVTFNYLPGGRIGIGQPCPPPIGPPGPYGVPNQVLPCPTPTPSFPPNTP